MNARSSAERGAPERWSIAIFSSLAATSWSWLKYASILLSSPPRSSEPRVANAARRVKRSGLKSSG